MIDSILNTIKKKIGVSEDDTCFDEAILTEINTAGSFLSQLGVTSLIALPSVIRVTRGMNVFLTELN